MTRPGKPATETPSRWPARLEQAALMIVLGVVCARGMIQERCDYEELSTVNRLGGTTTDVGGPGPATSLVFDGLALIALACCTVAAVIRGRWPVRPGGIELALILMIAAAALSLTAASNLRLAINTSLDRITAMLVLLVVSWTIRRWWQVRAVLAGIGAMGVTFAAFCMTQVYERQDTLKWITQQKTQAVESGRIAADDPMIRLLEQRARANEVSGFFAHSNISGSHLMVCALATLALGVARMRTRGRTFRLLFGVVALVAAGAMLWALGLTRSRGAVASVAVCGLGWLAAAVVWWRCASLRAWAVQRWKALLVAGWLAALLITIATVAWARHRGGLPGASLAFRWHYWTGAVHVMAEHPLVGVGADNFDRHYVRYKPVHVPEEVKNPHNYLVTMAAEWGAVGLVACIVLFVAASVVLCRPAVVAASGDSVRAGSPSLDGGATLLWLIPPLVMVLVARSTASPGQLWLIWALVPAVIWAIAYVGLSLDSDQPSRFENDPLPLLGGLIAAVLAAVLHNTISFSMIYPGSACAIFALAGLAIAVRRMEDGSARRQDAGALYVRTDETLARSRRIGLRFVALVCLAAAIFYWPLFVSPVVRASGLLASARSSAATREAIGFYRRAVEADPLDSVAPSELAMWAIRQAQHVPGQPADLVDLAVVGAQQAVARDPEDNRHYRTLASAYLTRYLTAGDPNDVDRAERAARNAIRLYPELPAIRVDYGEILALQAKTHETPELRVRAADQLRLALRLDDRRWTGEIRRFSDERRAVILKRIRELETQPTATSSPTTLPATRGEASARWRRPWSASLCGWIRCSRARPVNPL